MYSQETRWSVTHTKWNFLVMMLALRSSQNTQPRELMISRLPVSILSVLNTIFIGDDVAGDGGDGATVIDVVDAHRLKEIELDKKAWMGYIKGKWYKFDCVISGILTMYVEYLKRVKAKLEE